MTTSSYIFGILSSIFGIVCGVLGSLHHAYACIWTGCIAACLAAISGACWLHAAETKELTNPPQSLQTETVKGTNRSGGQMEEIRSKQQVTINNSNQTGGSNFGIINNFAPEGRKLSDSQVAGLTEAIRPFSREEKLSITAMAGDNESRDLAKQLTDAANACGMRLPVNILMSPDHSEGIDIAVKDAESAPPLAESIFKTLKEYGFVININSDPNIKDDSVNITVEYQPEKR